MSDTKICTRCGTEYPNTLEFFYKGVHGIPTNPCKKCAINKVPYIKPTWTERACTKCGVIQPWTEEFFYRKKGDKFAFPCKACQRKPFVEKVIPQIKTCNICLMEKTNTDEFFNRTGLLPPLAHLKATCKECNNKLKKEKRDNESPQERKIRLKKKVVSAKANRGTFRKGSYRSMDKKRGLNNDLTTEFVNNALNSPCTYCGFPSTGLDRINNNIGHTIANCVPCCKECNTARMDNFTHEEMKIIGQSIKQIKINRQHHEQLTLLLSGEL